MTSRREFCASVAAVLAAGPMLGASAPLRSTRARLSLDPWIEVDVGALARNARVIAGLAGNRPVIAVAKNNAYGTGLATTGPLLDALAEVRMLAVVRPEEALALRKAGVRKPILLMGPATEEELLELVPLGVVQSPYRDAAPTLLGRVARRLGRPVPVHLYVDTGMHRMGMPVAEALPWIQALTAGPTPAVTIEGAFTELVEDAEFDRAQASRMRELQAAARATGIAIPMLHAASSEAVQHQTTEAFLDAVRPGLALYGGYVSGQARERADLRPAIALKARVIRVDRLAAGDGVSYHRRWRTDRPVWTATLGVGHVDGYPSGAVKGCEVLLGGTLCPVVGTVSASHTIVALGEETSVKVGDVAVLVGGEHPAVHPNEVAKRAGYSEYDMFMHLSPSIARVVAGARAG